MTQQVIGALLGVPRNVVSTWNITKNIIDNNPRIIDISGKIVHNCGVVVHNFYQGHPPHPKPKLYVAPAQDLHYLPDKTVDIIITSPPYNLGQEKWPMGGGGIYSKCHDGENE